MELCVASGAIPFGRVYDIAPATRRHSLQGGRDDQVEARRPVGVGADQQGRVLARLLPQQSDLMRQGARLLHAASTAQPRCSVLPAYGLYHAKNFLGAKNATAHNVARLFFSILSTKKSFADIGLEAYEQQFLARRGQVLTKAAREFGFPLGHVASA